jgi:hypothetical protein
VRGRGVGLLDAVAFVALALFLAERATVLFVAIAALVTERVPAFALTAAFPGRRLAALRGVDFRAFALPATPSVSSAVNRFLSSLISCFLRESAAVTSRSASLPSAIRK